MKRALLFLCLPPLVHAQTLLAPAPNVLTIRVSVCNPYEETDECWHRLQAWKRAKDIAALLPMLTEDFKDIGDGHMNKPLRDHMAVIAARIAKNKYD